MYPNTHRPTLSHKPFFFPPLFPSFSLQFIMAEPLPPKCPKPPSSPLLPVSFKTHLFIFVFELVDVGTLLQFHAKSVP